jgi:adenosylcobinamide-GDP ribazoletransferase
VLIGAAVWLPVRLLAGHPLFAALLGVVIWVWITGALHLDGLGDVADALGAAHRRPDRFLEVLKDPHMGVFGVVSVLVQLIAKLVLLAELAPHHASLGLVLVPAWARWGSLLWTRALPALQDGLCDRFAWRLGWTSVCVWALLLAAASAVWAPWLLLAVPFALLVAGYWRRRLGGISGDCLGAGIEVTETFLLGALAVALGLTL